MKVKKMREGEKKENNEEIWKVKKVTDGRRKKDDNEEKIESERDQREKKRKMTMNVKKK